MENDMRDKPEGGTPPERGMASGRKATFGIIGMVLALVGMVASIAGPHIVEEAYPSETIDYDEATEKVATFVSDAAAKTGRKLVDAARDKAGTLFSRDRKKDADGEAEPGAAAAAQAKPRVEAGSRDRAFSLFRFVGIGGGIFAMFLGLLGWVRGEDHRAAVAASTMGFLAMAWIYIAAAIGLAVVAVILGAIFK